MSSVWHARRTWSRDRCLQLINMEVGASRQHSTPDPPVDDTADRKEALESLSVMTLHKLAVGGGVDVMTTLKTAMESDHTKAALIEILLVLPD